MDEFPFPVFSSTILEEVNQFKPAVREEAKKPGETEDPLFFFGGSPSSNSALLYAIQQHQFGQHAQQTAQAQPQAEGAHQQDQVRQPSGLGSSSLLLPPQLTHGLLFQMPQLSGLPAGVLEEDDKWILSLLNIDGVHENNPNAPTGF